MPQQRTDTSPLDNVRLARREDPSEKEKEGLSQEGIGRARIRLGDFLGDPSDVVGGGSRGAPAHGAGREGQEKEGGGDEEERDRGGREGREEEGERDGKR